VTKAQLPISPIAAAEEAGSGWYAACGIRGPRRPSTTTVCRARRRQAPQSVRPARTVHALGLDTLPGVPPYSGRQKRFWHAFERACRDPAASCSTRRASHALSRPRAYTKDICPPFVTSDTRHSRTLNSQLSQGSACPPEECAPTPQGLSSCSARSRYVLSMW
jgi:hypothetical protein